MHAFHPLPRCLKPRWLLLRAICLFPYSRPPQSPFKIREKSIFVQTLPPLHCHTASTPSHTRVFVISPRRCLDPQWLLRATYPVLSSYSSPDKGAYPRHSLSRAALVTSGSPIFLLDAFTTLIVYYAQNAPAELPFPPPQDCEWLGFCSLPYGTVLSLKLYRCACFEEVGRWSALLSSHPAHIEGFYPCSGRDPELIDDVV